MTQPGAARIWQGPDGTGAWKQDTFGVMNEAAAAGDPIVLTTLELPGVTRIQEASNKAIAKLQREDKKVRISLISTDEEVVCQPGDTVQVLSTYRGIDAPVWVESSRMTSYGRFQITGTVYRDRQYPDTDYADGGKLYLEGYTPVVTVNPDPACLPYSCSAYVDWLGSLSGDYLSGDATAEVSYRTTGDADVPWPWSTGAVDDLRHRMWSDFVSSPGIVSDWLSSAPSTNQFAEDLFTVTVSDAEFCTGSLNGMGAINNSTAVDRPKAVTPYSASTTDQTGCWGDHYMEALIMAHDIGSSGYVMNGYLVRDTSKCWTYTWNGANREIRSDILHVEMSTNSVSGDVTLTLSTPSTAFNFPTTSTSKVFPGAAKSLNLFQCHISSGAPIEVPRADNTGFGIVRPCTIQVWYAGDSVSHTGNLYGGAQKSGASTPITNVAEWKTVSSTYRLGAYARYFQDPKVNIASFAAGLLSTDSLSEVQERSLISWDRNNPAYLPPIWCAF